MWHGSALAGPSSFRLSLARGSLGESGRYECGGRLLAGGSFVTSLEQSVEDLRESIDVVIITVKAEEFNAVMNQFRSCSAGSARGGGRDYTLFDVPLSAVSDSQSRLLKVAVTRSPAQGQAVAEQVTRDVLRDLSPQWILLVGIAGCVPDPECSLGDVALGLAVFDLSVNAQAYGSPAEYAIKEVPVHPEVQNFAATVAGLAQRLGNWFDIHLPEHGELRRLDRPTVDLAPVRFVGPADWQAKVRKVLQGTETRSPQVVGVPIASSGSLVKDPEVVKAWLQVARQIRAIEMEAAGVYRVAHGRPPDVPVPALAIKGISDIVGYVKEEAWVRYACEAAAAFAYAFLATGFINPRAVSGDRSRTGCGPLEDLRSYPLGPMVPAHHLPPSIISQYGDRYSSHDDRVQVVNQAISLRLSVEPNVGRNGILTPGEMPSALVRGRDFWFQILTSAGNKSPRMLAALLLSVDPIVFDKEGQLARLQLLEKLRKWS